MDDDETFDEFYAILKDIVNSTFNLGERIPKPQIVRKILKSLLEQFHAKITAIEEAKDIDRIPLIELIGNLQTYALGLVRIGKGSKSKNMALKAKNDEEEGSFEDENSKFKAYITKKFKKFIKNANVKVSDKDHKKSGFRHPNFQNNSLGIQIRQRPFNFITLFQKYANFQNTFLWIQIWQQPFNLITFASKVSKFSKYLSRDSNLAATI